MSWKLHGVVAVLLGVWLAGCSKEVPRASKDEMAKLEQLIQKSEAQVAADLALWRKGIRSLAAGALPLTTKTCPLPPGGTSLPNTTVRMPNLDKLVPKDLRHHRDELRRARKMLKDMRDRVRKRLPKSTYRHTWKRLTRKRKREWHLVLVVESEVRPKMVSARKYSPGYLKGRLLLWSYEERKYTCAAQVVAHSSKKIRVYDGRKGRTLQWGLESNARRDGFKKLRVLR